MSKRGIFSQEDVLCTSWKCLDFMKFAEMFEWCLMIPWEFT